ncbi:DsbA family protein [Candidatus Micrarchaeota archaeon]|nr:DsbA family protein [Candidatus Micrarchaeota archaeon]
MANGQNEKIKTIVYGLIILGALILAGFLIFAQGEEKIKEQEIAQPVIPTGNGIVNLIDDDMKKGSDSAPLVMVEFSDFECPYCKNFWSQTLPQIERDYIDTGKLQIVYRDFPLSFHPAAQKAAEATECADDQGKGWEMHDKIYENQASLGSTEASAIVNFKSWASELGLDRTNFDQCLDSDKYASEVQNDANDGAAIGIRGTPAFRLGKRNGDEILEISGAQPYSIFQSTIEQLLEDDLNE